MTRIEQSSPVSTIQLATVGKLGRLVAGVVCLLLVVCLALLLNLPQATGHLFVGLCGMGIFLAFDAMGPLLGLTGVLLLPAAVLNAWAGKGLPAKARVVWQLASVSLLATAAALILAYVALNGAGQRHAIIPGYHLPWLSLAVVTSAYAAAGFLLISRAMALPAATSTSQQQSAAAA